MTSLQQSPFAILGASTRDSRKRVVDLAEEKSLKFDPDIVQKARADLTNPRTRLTAELAWLPGVAPRKARQLVQAACGDAMAIRTEPGLPTLAHLNLLVAAIAATDASQSGAEMAGVIHEVGYRTQRLSADDVLRDVNEDRAVSGFPEVRARDLVEAELGERARYYRMVIRNALDRLPSGTLIRVMTETVNRATHGGGQHAPALIDDLVDGYEVETQGLLTQEAENIHRLIKAARESAGAGDVTATHFVVQIEKLARNWTMVAKPIQVSFRARGLNHRPSNDLAYKIRALAIDLFNQHDLLVLSRRLTDCLLEAFGDLAEFAALARKDADVFKATAERRAGG